MSERVCLCACIIYCFNPLEIGFIVQEKEKSSHQMPSKFLILIESFTKGEVTINPETHRERESNAWFLNWNFKGIFSQLLLSNETNVSRENHYIRPHLSHVAFGGVGVIHHMFYFCPAEWWSSGVGNKKKSRICEQWKRKRKRSEATTKKHAPNPNIELQSQFMKIQHACEWVSARVNDSLYDYIRWSVLCISIEFVCLCDLSIIFI